MFKIVLGLIIGTLLGEGLENLADFIERKANK